eukprot:GHVQ01014226.1.p1 GENE.GHVQ01014226.1~~GHVQ01014226.1.p1  ORF type:complete len:420 (+),score=35.69 GHVQ01014226.1:135-1394(+)
MKTWLVPESPVPHPFKGSIPLPGDANEQCRTHESVGGTAYPMTVPTHTASTEHQRICSAADKETQRDRVALDTASMITCAVRGLEYVHNDVEVSPRGRTVVSSIRDYSKVSVICGGGSGHEPGFAGFVGPGMLTGAVAGDIFSSPSVHHVLEAILAVTTHCKEETREKDAVLPPPPSSHGTSTVSNCNHSMLAETCIGSQATNAPQATDSRLTSCNNCLEYKRVEIGRCLVLCLNYTGDRLNFGLAADRAETMLRRLHAIKSSDSKSHKHESRVRPASLPAGSSDEDVVVDLGTSADSNDKRRFVEIVFVGDDASLSRDRISCSSGRRGLAGTILVIKAACAAAALGYSLEAVKRVAEIASRNVATVGLSFAPVQIPGAPLCQEFISRAEQFDNGHGMMELVISQDLWSVVHIGVFCLV